MKFLNLNSEKLSDQSPCLKPLRKQGQTVRDEDTIELEFTEDNDEPEDFSNLVKKDPEEVLPSKHTFRGYVE